MLIIFYLLLAFTIITIIACGSISLFFYHIRRVIRSLFQQNGKAAPQYQAYSNRAFHKWESIFNKQAIKDVSYKEV